MLFNTLEFALFLLVVLAIAPRIAGVGAQKAFYLYVSYVFYLWWHPALLLLLLAATVINHWLTQWMARADGVARKRRLWAPLLFSLSLLAWFKYFAFLETLLRSTFGIGGELSWVARHIVLPVGISFYTFHAISYTVDVYRREIKPASLLDYALYLAFFPHLVAGPIVRAQHLIPQFATRKTVRVEVESVLLIARGLIKKVVIADNLSPLVDAVFKDPASFPSAVIMLAALAFAVQIYCDFSGYTDMAIGMAKLFGFEFPQNFNRPYFSTTPAEFWQRWHMSLSRWLRDYLYIALGGNRFGELKTLRNLMLTMLLGGLWHGASWNFVWWGAFHGGLLVIYRVLGLETRIERGGRGLQLGAWAVFFYLTLIGWILFRITDPAQLAIALKKFIVFDGNFALAGIGLGGVNLFSSLLLLGGFCVLHAIAHRIGGFEVRMATWSTARLAAVFMLIGAAFYWLMPSASAAFIYFQF
jgi:alginate O-acetyltransferase complex protein AlgI